jgi:hypothetical protein
VHDKKAKRIWDVLAELEAAGLVILADKGHQGAAHAKIPYCGKNKPESQEKANRANARLRAPASGRTPS